MLPVAATCSRHLEPQSSFLTPGLFQSLTHGATDHWATMVPGTRVWLKRGGSRLAWGRGLGLGPAQSSPMSWQGTSQNPKGIFGPGENHVNDVWFLTLKIPRCWFTNQKAV